MEAVLAVLLMLVPLGGASPAVGGGDGPGAGHAGEAPQGVPYPGGFFGQDETVVVSVENFRFCVRICRPDSVAYVRTPVGPLPESDNPRAVVYMQPGARFTWTYRDRGCDLLRCRGHDLRLEDGTADGQRIGQVSGGSGHDRLTWTIPADAAPEAMIRYFCARHAGLGMTGAFQVLPITVLSVSPPAAGRGWPAVLPVAAGFGGQS